MKNKFSISSFLFVLALTILVSASVMAQAFDPMTIRGPVTAYTPADCGKAGSVTIAGQTFVIAAGVDTIFLDTMQVIGGNGGLTTANVKSERWQVVTSPTTGRTMGVYLDSQNRIRKQVVTSINPTSTRSLDITGVVTDFVAATATTTGSLKIHGLTFTIAAGSTVPVAISANTVRVIGTLNGTDQLTVTTVGDPYRKLTLCGAPTLYFSSGANILGLPDINAFDAAGPIGVEVLVFNPLGTAGSQTLCDESVEVMGVDGATNIAVAPNFSIRHDISKDVNACYDLNLDAFGWMSTGSKKVSGTGNKSCGVFEAFTAATTVFPTSRNEAQQRGSLTLSGLSFTIASGNEVTFVGGPAVGAQACLVPVISSGQTAPFLTGQQAPPRTGQLINGSTLTKQ